MLLGSDGCRRYLSTKVSSAARITVKQINSVNSVAQTYPSKILLVNPPVAKPSEPPAGIARLAGALRGSGCDCRVLDLNLLCLAGEFDRQTVPADRWSARAYKNCQENLEKIRSPKLYRSADRYRRVVRDLSRVLSVNGKQSGCELSLANFSDPRWSPLASTHLLECVEHFAENHFYAQFAPLLTAELEEYQPDCVGLSLSFLSQALTGFAVMGFIRNRFPEIKIVAGGGLLTSWMSSPGWNDPFGGLIDTCIGGPGERPLLEMFGKSGGSTLGTFSYADADMGAYLSPGPVLPYAASHGCYWKKCAFCPDFAEDACFAARAPAAAVSEIGDLVSQHSPVLVHLLDNALSPALLQALCSRPIAAPWYGFARFEKELCDFDFCRALRKSGCVMLKLGLESGSQAVLDRLHKGIDLGQASTILANLERAGIGAYVYLLFGTPAEKEEDALLSLDFVRRHHRAINFLNLAVFNMPIGSAEAVQRSNRFSEDDLSLYCDFIHPDGWDRKKVRAFLQKRFRKDPLINAIEIRSPGVFGSNHAPFLLH